MLRWNWDLAPLGVCGLGHIDPLVNSRDEMGARRQELVNVRGIKGIAPQCKVLSLKVWNDEKKHVKASRVIAALAYINRVNGDGRIPKVHGVNISLGYEFDPTWFACGQSPLCVEVDRLVRSGTVVDLMRAIQSV